MDIMFDVFRYPVPAWTSNFHEALESIGRSYLIHLMFNNFLSRNCDTYVTCQLTLDILLDMYSLVMWHCFDRKNAALVCL